MQRGLRFDVILLGVLVDFLPLAFYEQTLLHVSFRDWTVSVLKMSGSLLVNFYGDGIKSSS